MTSGKARENRLRRWAGRLGYVLHKDRARAWSIDHLGGYMIVEANRNAVVRGERFEYSIDDVEAFLAGEEARLRAEFNEQIEASKKTPPRVT